MLFYRNLDQIVYERYKLFKCDDIVIISGYVGPAPIESISHIPLHTTVIYGMYGSDGIGTALHSSLMAEDRKHSNVDILYSTVPVHSKIYMWRYKGEVTHALVGSANFSTNGLTTPYKETLAETTADTFEALDRYYKHILSNCLGCRDGKIELKRKSGFTSSKVAERRYSRIAEEYNPKVCHMPLYIINKETGEPEVPPKSGLNWGMAYYSGSHVNKDDAYIPINAFQVEQHPEMFPVKRTEPVRKDMIYRADHRDNDPIDIIWDDGTTMTGLLEGSRVVKTDGIRKEYPKQIATTPNKSELGRYIRQRMGIPEGKAITLSDLDRYGRRTIDISLQGEGIYYLDFSV